jgi:plasmid stabilization system protein ParE
MVSKIIWAPRALEDLRDVTNYIRRHNPDAAYRFGLKLIEKAESLATFPERGRVIAKFQDPNIRLLPHCLSHQTRATIGGNRPHLARRKERSRFHALGFAGKLAQVRNHVAVSPA